MKTKKLNTVGLAAILTVAITAVAFAYDGYGSPMGGYGGHHMMGPGYGRHMMGNDGDCGPYMHGDRRWQVSSLQSDFDQKAVTHRLEMRKLLPDNYRAAGDDDGYCW